MNKALITRIIPLLTLCLLLLFGSFLLGSSLMLAVEQPPEPTEVFYRGVIDYEDGQYPDLTPQTSTQQVGKQLFEKNCQSCHNPTDEALVGPGLRGITIRQSDKWIIKWIRNPERVLKSGDRYANSLYIKFNRTSMPAFDSLSRPEIRAILAYIDKK